MYVCMYVCMYICMYVCMYVCTYVCVCVCVCVCVRAYVYVIFKNQTISIISLSAVLSIIVQIGHVTGGP